MTDSERREQFATANRRIGELKRNVKFFEEAKEELNNNAEIVDSMNLKIASANKEIEELREFINSIKYSAEEQKQLDLMQIPIDALQASYEAGRKVLKEWDAKIKQKKSVSIKFGDELAKAFINAVFDAITDRGFKFEDTKAYNDVKYQLAHVARSSIRMTSRSFFINEGRADAICDTGINNLVWASPCTIDGVRYVKYD